MSERLSSARAKLARANLHAGTFKREATRFLKNQEQPTFGGQFNADFSQYGLFVERGLPDPPASFAQRLGDAIHNYRCALDHLAWQLSGCGAGLTEGQTKRVGFPFIKSESTFGAEVTSRVPNTTPDVIRFIKSRQRYDRGQAAESPLSLLIELSNDDKHRNLHPTVVGLDKAVVSYECFNCLARGHGGAIRSPAMKKGAIVGAILMVNAGPDSKVEVNIEVTPRVGLEGGRDVIILLDEFKAEVVEILEAPEILTALK